MSDTWYDMGFDADMSWMYDWKGKEKKMTIDEAIDILEEVKELDDSIYQYNTKYLKALNMVIKAAKQQSMSIITSTEDNAEMIYPQVEGITPTIVRDVPDINVGDLISRQAVLGLPKIKTRNTWGEVIYESVDVEDIKQLPHVNPQPCEDAISRQAVNTLVDELARAISDERCCISRGRSTATIMQDILDLPPVNPQESTGHWIIMGDRYIKCSECGHITKTESPDIYHFCMVCGANMSEIPTSSKPEINSYYGLKSYVRERSK